MWACAAHPARRARSSPPRASAHRARTHRHRVIERGGKFAGRLDTPLGRHAVQPHAPIECGHRDAPVRREAQAVAVGRQALLEPQRAVAAEHAQRRLARVNRGDEAAVGRPGQTLDIAAARIERTHEAAARRIEHEDAMRAATRCGRGAGQRDQRAGRIPGGTVQAADLAAAHRHTQHVARAQAVELPDDGGLVVRGGDRCAARTVERDAPQRAVVAAGVQDERGRRQRRRRRHACLRQAECRDHAPAQASSKRASEPATVQRPPLRRGSRLVVRLYIGSRLAPLRDEGDAPVLRRRRLRGQHRLAVAAAFGQQPILGNPLAP